VVADLRTVLTDDSWRGTSWGRDWILAWKKWRAPFDDPSKFHFGKEGKRCANYRWYFGCDPPTTGEVPLPSCLTLEHERSEVATSMPLQLNEAAVSSTGGEAAVNLIMRPQQKPPRPPPASVVPSSKLSRPEASVIEGLGKDDAYESLTIGTLTSTDTIPLGTDLDPQNHYNNLWAASQVKDPNGKLLVQYNLCCRVLDAENVGYSFGREVLGKSEFYDVEGVRRAAAHFQSKGIDVVIVTKRQDMAQCLSGDGIQVVIAERTDDLVVIKQAQSRNCPIVSRDGFAKWRTDLRVATELRQWLSESASLQVRFSWGTGGDFVPDFDLPRPVVRPAHRSSAASGSLM